MSTTTEPTTVEERRGIVWDQCVRRYRLGCDFIKSNHVARLTEMRSDRAGAHLRELSKDGYLDVFNKGSNSKVYEFTEKFEDEVGDRVD